MPTKVSLVWNCALLALIAPAALLQLGVLALFLLRPTAAASSSALAFVAPGLLLLALVVALLASRYPNLPARLFPSLARDPLDRFIQDLTQS